jgi:hypothetical protein
VNRSFQKTKNQRAKMDIKDFMAFQSWHSSDILCVFLADIWHLQALHSKRKMIDCNRLAILEVWYQSTSHLG